ncbi:MAG: galactokinase family protein [Ilumatobacteraceae bacterium]
MPIHVRAPGRVNLIGEHTDYNGGLVFPMSIDRWTEIVGEASDRIHLNSESEDLAVDLELDEPFDATLEPRWGRYVAAVSSLVRPTSGIDGLVTTTIPVGAGLSSSASLELAVALALGFAGTPTELAQLGQRAEHLATSVPTGIMDQLCIAASTAGHALMLDCHTLEFEHVPVPDDVEIVVRFIAHRTLEGSEYTDRVEQCRAAEAAIGPLRSAGLDRVAELGGVVARRARHVITENARVLEFAAALRAGDYASAGDAMVRSHRSMAEDFEISTPAMDAAVDALLEHPAVHGARMTGGGFGGCVIAMCERGADLEGWKVRPVEGARRLEV